jgi:hypothetical protein
MSLVVLIALPFTAPFAMFDPRDFAARGRAVPVADTVVTSATDDVSAWVDRSALHHAMHFAALHSGPASLAVLFLRFPLPPLAMTAVPHSTAVLAAVLRV